ncbi:phosphotransferase [Kitasatospora sp. RB6PN24]|uniref:phosphotransferase enzyme family protein n=1 Tax=Kitasatospora humi TaxID=2893891 RepID=UPI001E5CAB55|nr:phosphotransferase [Kitasatospora humi]MCC9309169.1 phosphotransferase [Kitasatospora humi]
MPNTETTALATALERGYDLPGAVLERLPIGQVTVNYRAQLPDQTTLFVKHYPAGTDLPAERAAIAQSRLAGKHGVPVATVRPSRVGEAIIEHDGHAISVWEWVGGRTVEDGLNPAQQRAAGRALGTIHHAFAGHPAAANTSSKLDRWMNPDLQKLEAGVDKLLGVVNERAQRDDFDEQALRTLTERRSMLHRVPGLIADLPPLSTQVLHGDYSAVNLLFDGDALTAVLDFLPPDPFLTAYELGRIAFDPRAVVLHEDWITSGVTLASAYLETNPHLPAADVRACARVALLQLVTSLYGVKQHYLEPGLLQDDLDSFWLLRHAAAQRLLERLEEVEAALGEAATQHAR